MIKHREGSCIACVWMLFIPVGAICVKLCLTLGVRVMGVFILGNESIFEAQRVAIIEVE